MHFPPEKKHCHRTGFEKVCKELVTSEKCTRWVNMDCLGTGGETVEVWGCKDDLVQIQNNTILKRLAGIQEAVEGRGNATIEKLEEIKDTPPIMIEGTDAKH